MKNDIVLSIIVPVYNVEKYLDECLESIIKNYDQKIEVILVDDGSKDNSSVLCDEYAKEYNFITVIHKENGGLSSARNAGLDIANGKYIGFVDSDDFIDDKMINMLYRELIKNNSDISFCKFKITYENKYININIESDFKSINYSGEESLLKLYDSEGKYIKISCGKLYKKELFNRLRFIEGKNHEDEFIIHRLLYKCTKITYVPYELYYYYQSENSIMRSGGVVKFDRRKLDGLYAYMDRIEFLREIKKIDIQYKAEHTFIETFFRYYFKSKYILNLDKDQLSELKYLFINQISYFLKNPLYTKREKIAWIIFIINENFYAKRFIESIE